MKIKISRLIYENSTHSLHTYPINFSELEDDSQNTSMEGTKWGHMENSK